MKKLFSLILVLSLVACAVAFAEGPLYDGDINFGGTAFGTTYGEIRSAQFIQQVTYLRCPVFSRIIADGMGERIGDMYADWETTVPKAFYATTWSPVAGYENVIANLYFNITGDENSATLIGGRYEFLNATDNQQAAFDDLKAKLTGAYGEPWLETTTATEIWGELALPENYSPDDLDESQINPRYVVWKSSSNGGLIVLCNCMKWGMDQTLLSYVSTDQDEGFSALPTGEDAPNDSTAGL